MRRPGLRPEDVAASRQSKILEDMLRKYFLNLALDYFVHSLGISG
jgi:hypothetical protein